MRFIKRKTDSEPLGSWLGGCQSPDASGVGDCVFPQQHHCLLPREPSPPRVSRHVSGAAWGLPGGLNNVLPVCGSAQPRIVRRRNLKESGYQCEWRYNSCAPACPVTCQHPEPLACPVQCVEGCHAHCPPGGPSAPVWGWHGGWGLVLRKVPPCPASSQPHPRALLSPAPSPYGLFPTSFHQSQGQLRFLPS